MPRPKVAATASLPGPIDSLSLWNGDTAIVTHSSGGWQRKTMRNLVAAVDMATGDVRWLTKVALPPSVVACHDGDGYCCTNVIGNAKGSLVAIDLASGKIRWEKRVNGLHALSRPTVTGKDVLVPGAQAVLAFDRAGGKPAWAVKTGRSVHANIVVTPEPMTAYAACSASGEVVAIDVNSGRESWRERVSTQEIIGIAIAAGRLVVLRPYDPLLALNPADGEPVGKAKHEGASDAVIVDNFTYFEADYDGETKTQVVCFDVKSLKTKWTWKVDLTKRKTPYGFPPVLACADRVYVASHGGDVIALERAAGKPAWELTNTGDSFHGYRFPAARDDDGSIVVYSRAGDRNELITLSA